jgi:hypothetical protein
MYEDRLVAYFDIIGWSAACAATAQADLQRVKDTALFLSDVADDYSERSFAVLEEQAARVPGSRVNPLRREIRTAVFSDNYVISMPLTHGPRVASHVGDLARGLLARGFLVRGGLALGRLYHSHGVVFGPALVTAVALEKETRLPRILCAPDVVDFINGGPLGGSAPIVQDCLMRWTVNLYDIRATFPGGETLSMHRKFFEADHLEAVIGRNHSANASRPDRLEKWVYAAAELRAGLARVAEADKEAV